MCRLFWLVRTHQASECVLAVWRYALWLPLLLELAVLGQGSNRHHQL